MTLRPVENVLSDALGEIEAEIALKEEAARKNDNTNFSIGRNDIWLNEIVAREELESRPMRKSGFVWWLTLAVLLLAAAGLGFLTYVLTSAITRLSWRRLSEQKGPGPFSSSAHL
jgi:hypothetical protein